MSDNANGQVSAVRRRHNPYVLIALLLGCVVASVVDVTFLADVVGRILNMETTEATAISAVIGLVAMIMLMGLYGYMEAYGDTSSKWYKCPEVWIWIVLGLFLAIIRLASANIIEVDANTESMLTIGAIKMRVSDIIMAPMMFVLYLASGLASRYCINKLFGETSFLDDLGKKMADNKQKRELGRQKAMDDRERQQAEREARMKQEAELRAEKVRAQREIRDSKAKLAPYNEALSEYQELERLVHDQYDVITGSIAKLERLNREEEQVDNIRNRFAESIERLRVSSQNQVALLVRDKTKSGTHIDTLKGIIDEYNSEHKL